MRSIPGLLQLTSTKARCAHTTRDRASGGEVESTYNFGRSHNTKCESCTWLRIARARAKPPPRTPRTLRPRRPVSRARRAARTGSPGRYCAAKSAMLFQCHPRRELRAPILLSRRMFASEPSGLTIRIVTGRPRATIAYVSAALLAGLLAAVFIKGALGWVNELDDPPPAESWVRRVPATSTAALPLEWVASGAGTLELTRTEITVGQYRACASCAAPESGGYCPILKGPPNFPIACVNAKDAEIFCRSIGGRLPLHREWIAAASLGGRAKYPWGDEPPTCERVVASIGRSQECRPTGVIEVCSRPLGKARSDACDLLGNVAEWTIGQDEYIAAGGSWGHTATAALALEAREVVDREYRADSIGIRCVRGELTSR